MNFGDPRLPERFWTKVVVEPNSGCWFWTGAMASDNPQIRWRVDGVSRRLPAYRVALLAIGIETDVAYRTCRNVYCTNPAHTSSAASFAEAMREVAKLRPPQTHCVNGHELAVVGVYRKGTRFQHCKRCHSERVSVMRREQFERRLKRARTPEARALLIKRREAMLKRYRNTGKAVFG